MSSKRKPDGTKKAVKKRKNSESNYDSDLSDEYPRAGEPSTREVVVEELRPMEKLPEELLAVYDKGPGKLLIAGMVSWEMTGKRDSKGVTKIRPNLFTFHRFTGDEESLSPEAVAAVEQLLEMDQTKRPAAEQMQRMPFFACIDWKNMSQLEPPFIPNPDDPQDTGYFEARNIMQHLKVSNFNMDAF